MSTWALIVVMKYAIHVASYSNIVVDGFGTQQKCEEAAKQMSLDSDYKRHICLEVKQ